MQVDPSGFEPEVSPVQGERDTGLRYKPNTCKSA